MVFNKLMVKRIMSKLCSCGCGKEVTWNRYSKQYNNFISGHSSRGKISPRKGQKVSDETRLKMRLAQLGKKQSEELKRKLSSIRKGILKGRPHSLEHSLKISKSKKGIPSINKGKKLEEIVGEEKALQIKEKISIKASSPFSTILILFITACFSKNIFQKN